MTLSWRSVWMAVLLAQTMAAACATDIYVCDSGGGIEYRDDARGRDCRKRMSSTVGEMRVRQDSAMQPEAASATRPVDPDEQQAVLRERLAVERGKLEALRRDYNGGQPERRGDERNYAKYQARTAALLLELQASQARVEALQRQLER